LNLSSAIHVFAPLDDMSHERKIEQGLPSLKLNFELRRWTPEHEINRQVGGRFRHIERLAVVRYSRDLTVLAGMIAPKCDDEDVQGRQVRQAGLAGSVLRRQKLRVRFRISLAQEMPCFEVKILVVVAAKSVFDKRLKFRRRQHDVLSGEITRHVSLRI